MKALRRLVIFLIWSSAVAMPAAPQNSDSQPDIANPAWSELQRSMANMHLAMASVQPSGNSDTDFVRLMLAHHQAAINMARIQIVYGTDTGMHRLAQEIITDQQSEIALMQIWLKHHPDSSKLQQKPTM